MAMRTFIVAFALAIVGLVTAAQPASAQEIHPVDLDGETVNLVVPDGYCVLDESKPDQAALRALYYPAASPKRRPLLFFMACDLLTAPDAAPFVTAAGSEDVGFYVYSAYWTELLERDEASRSDYIDFIEMIYGSAPIGWLRNDLKARFEASNDPMQSAMLVYETDLRGSDSTALYQILRIEAFHSGQKGLFGGAVGETPIRQRVVQAVLLRRIDDVNELESMHDEIEDLMDELVDANPDSDN